MLRNKLMNSLKWYAEKLDGYLILVADFGTRVGDETNIHMLMVDDDKGLTILKLLLNEVLCPFEEELCPKFRKLNWKDHNTSLYFHISVWLPEEYAHFRKQFEDWSTIQQIVGPID